MRQKREELRLPKPVGGRSRWTQEEIALLGTMPDEEVAKKVGRSVASVTQKRCKLGIATFRDRRQSSG